MSIQLRRVAHQYKYLDLFFLEICAIPAKVQRKGINIPNSLLHLNSFSYILST